MGFQQVFSGVLATQAPNITTKFVDAIGFFIDAPTISQEIQIDCFLQVYFPFPPTEKVRVFPFGKIEEQAILLNITDTESVIKIPQELSDTNLEMSIVFLASEEIQLDVYILQKNYSLPQAIEELNSKLNLIIDALNIPTPATIPTSEQQQFFFVN